MLDSSPAGAGNHAIPSTQHGSACPPGLEHAIKVFRKEYSAALSEKQELIDGLKQVYEVETEALKKIVAVREARIQELEKVLEEFQTPSRAAYRGTKGKRQKPVATKKRKRHVSNLRRELTAFENSLQASSSESLPGVARVTAEVEMLVGSVPCVAEDEDSGTEHEHYHAFEAIKKSCQGFLKALNAFKQGGARQLSFDAIKESCRDLSKALYAFERHDAQVIELSDSDDDDEHRIDKPSEASGAPRQDEGHAVRESPASEEEDTRSLDSSEEMWCYCHRRLRHRHGRML